jgi:Bacterial protein of unknown function (DUF899)
MQSTATKTKVNHQKVVSPAEWLVARKEHLAKEKEFTRLRDELSRQRRELPWERVEKSYVFDGPRGKETLADLFDGRGVRAGLEGGLPRLLVRQRSFRRHDHASGESRHYLGCGFARALGSD